MNIDIFDVLVVYTDRLAVSASTLEGNALLPFAKGSGSESYNTVYSYFLKVCQKNGLKVAFTTSADIIGAGKCQSYWLYEDNNWLKVRKACFSKLIFDKFSPINRKIRKSRLLLFSSNDIKSFNNPHLFDLFFDKQKTYEKLGQFSIPTVEIDGNTTKSVDRACARLKIILKKHPCTEDFSDEIIVKDRFGAGGLNIYKHKFGQSEKIAKILQKHKLKSFIIQPFVKFDKGFTYNNSPVSTDIRLIYLRGEIVQTYIRMAKPNDFRCNEHQGGTLKYIPQSLIPANIYLLSNEITKTLNKKSSLFALDFIISNSGNIYFLEGNSGPGLDWDLSNKENETEAQKLIQLIIKELVKLAIPTRITVNPPENKVFISPVIYENPLPVNDSLLA